MNFLKGCHVMKKLLAIIFIFSISCFILSGCEGVSESSVKDETELETGNTFFNSLKGITKISASPSCTSEYFTEDKEVIERVVTYLKTVELEETDNGLEEGGGSVTFYSGDEEVMSIGTDSDQYVVIDGVVYHRVNKKGMKETLTGIFRSVWDDYGTR